MKAKDFVPYIGIALIVCTILCGAWVNRYYDVPISQWLKRVWRGRIQAATARTSFG